MGVKCVPQRSRIVIPKAVEIDAGKSQRVSNNEEFRITFDEQHGIGAKESPQCVVEIAFEILRRTSRSRLQMTATVPLAVERRRTSARSGSDARNVRRSGSSR